MLRIVLIGSGKMGRQVLQKIREAGEIECVGVVSARTPDLPGQPAIYQRLADVPGQFDVIIDFSYPERLEMIADYVKQHPVALVLATTGYKEAQIRIVRELADRVPVVYTANFSMGIAIMARVLAQIKETLPEGFDIEVIEKHHNQKVDSPSGTAKMLVKAMDPGKEYKRIYGRKGDGRRGREIGIHAVRGGTIAGEHTVIFAGEDETLEITHSASSKQIFANGALQAARFVAEQSPGLYDMNHVLFG